VPKRDQPKMHQKSRYLSNPRGRTWTARDRFSAPSTVVKQYHIAGNTVVRSCHKIRNNDDRDFAPKMTLIRTKKLCFESLGCVVNPLGLTEPFSKSSPVQFFSLKLNTVLLCSSLLLQLLMCCILLRLVDLSWALWVPSGHSGSLTTANWVSFDFNVAYSSC